jgi:hypothetical protein
MGITFIEGLVRGPQGEERVPFLIDSGATYSLLPEPLLGWSQRRVALSLYGVGGLLGAIAVGLVAFHPPWVAWVATVVGLTLAGGVAIALFERLPFEPQAGVRWREVWKTGVALLRR